MCKYGDRSVTDYAKMGAEAAPGEEFCPGCLADGWHRCGYTKSSPESIRMKGQRRGTLVYGQPCQAIVRTDGCHHHSREKRSLSYRTKRWFRRLTTVAARP